MFQLRSMEHPRVPSSVRITTPVCLKLNEVVGFNQKEYTEKEHENEMDSSVVRDCNLINCKKKRVLLVWRWRRKPEKISHKATKS